MASSAYFILEGTSGEGLGASISGAGDFAQQSGPDEFIIGTRNFSALGAIIFEGSSFSTNGIEADASNLGYVRILTNTGEGTGTVVLGGYDIDGDGFDDVLISAPLAGSADGAVYVLYGGETALDRSDLNISTSPLDGTNGSLINGFDSVDGFGSSLAVNEDSIGPTILIGGPTFGESSLADQGGVASVDASAAIGVSTDVTGNDADGENGGDQFGTSIAAGFDMDGDNEGDIAVGAPRFDGTGTDRGKVYVQLDGASFSVVGAADADMAGTVVSSAGDINGDTYDDLLITAPGHGTSDQGAVYIIYGKPTFVDGTTYDLGALDASDGIKLSGGIANGEVGIDATNLGDVSGDGIDDILIAGFDGDAGRAYLVFGGFGITSFNLEDLDGTNGYILSNIDLGLFGDTLVVGGLGDVNNDGINDFAIGTPDANFGDGKVFGLLGGTENLAGLDSADGADDGEIDVGAYLDGDPPEAAFIETDSTVEFGGTTTGTIDLRLDQSQVSGTISIVDTDTPGADTFDTIAESDPLTDGTPEGTGNYGVLYVDDDDTENWTYILNATAAGVIALGAGQAAADQVILTASNGSQRAINITIIGKDDPTQFTVTPDENGFGITEDLFSISGTFAAVDPDQNQDADFSGQTIQGTYGVFIIEEGGTFTYVLDQVAIQNAGGGPVTETISPVGTDDEFSFDILASGSPYVLDDGNGNTDGNGVTVFFGDGDQDVTGTVQDDVIDTGAGNDTVNGGGGNDVITDPFGDDALSGGAGNDSITALSGQNTIDDAGGTAADVNYFQGGVGRDTITGGDGVDYIKGDISKLIGGADRLDGGAENDFLSGGLGADTFVFGNGYGADRIADFSIEPSGGGFSIGNITQDFTVGLDVVELILGTPTTFDALNIADNPSGDAVLDLGGGDTLTFVGVSAAELTADSFIFNFV